MCAYKQPQDRNIGETMVDTPKMPTYNYGRRKCVSDKIPLDLSECGMEKSNDQDSKSFKNVAPRMKKVVREATETQKFYEDTLKYRQQDRLAASRLPRAVSLDSQSEDDLPPVFNKRLFASQGTVVLTPEARRIMRKNESRNITKDSSIMPKSELLAMRAVVEGLKLIHKGKDYIKDCLSQVVTYESYAPWEYITKKTHEENISCYYIVHGAVEVTYGISVTESKNMYQPNIIYNHGSGEYLGLVSPEGWREDLAPPATIYTKEACEFLRIDRTSFHQTIERILTKEAQEKRKYLASGPSVLSLMPQDGKEKVLPKLLKQEYPPNKIIIHQDETADDFFIILSGRCNAFRQVFIPETNKEVTFFMAELTAGNFFAEECVLNQMPSICTLITTCHTVCYKMHRSGLEIVSKDYLANIIQEHRNQYATDDELQDKGYSTSVWNHFKHNEVKTCLTESRRPYLLTTKHWERAQTRPPGERELRRENMYRFVLKGSGMQPVRVRSAVNRSVSPMSLPARSKSALDPMIEDDTSETESDITDTKSVQELVHNNRRTSRRLVPAVARVLEKHHKSISETKDKKWMARRKLSLLTQEIDKVGAANSAELYKFLQDNTELTKQFKTAWIDDMERESLERNFMDNGVLVSMNSDDIVRKAKAIADTFADKVKPKKTSSFFKEDEDWETILRTENKQSKVFIAVSKYRTETLRKKLIELQSQRTRERKKGRLPSRSMLEEQTLDDQKKLKGFVLDKIADGIRLDADKDAMRSSSIAGVLMVGKAVQKFKRSAKLMRSKQVGKSFERLVKEHTPATLREEPELPVTSRRRPSSAVVTWRDMKQAQLLVHSNMVSVDT